MSIDGFKLQTPKSGRHEYENEQNEFRRFKTKRGERNEFLTIRKEKPEFSDGTKVYYFMT